jgi:hypothetical protein
MNHFFLFTLLSVILVSIFFDLNNLLFFKNPFVFKNRVDVRIANTT